MKNRKQLAAFLAAGSVLAGAVPVLAQEDIQTQPKELLTVHFIDVGQGLAILAQAGDETLVYDGGNRDASSKFVAYLQEKGVDKIDYMIASHYDSDHLSGLIGALNVFETDTILGPDYEHDSKLYSSFYDTVEKQGRTVEYPQPGSQY